MPNYTYVYDKMTKIHYPQIPSVTEVTRLITPEILSPDIVGRAETEEGRPESDGRSWAGGYSKGLAEDSLAVFHGQSTSLTFIKQVD